MRAILSLALILAASPQAYGQAPNVVEVKQSTVSTDWKKIQAERSAALSRYLDQKQVAYRWFSDFPFGLTSGVPFLVLKLLPVIAPGEWGSRENFLDVVGLFRDERNQGYPIALGFGWNGLARDDALGAVDYASLTCGACHIGRVRLDDGSIRYLDGGVNTHFNLPQYRVRVVNTIKQMTGDATTPDEKTKRATAAILQAMDKVHAEDKNYFYRNYALGSRQFDAAYEEKQIGLFKQNAPAIVQSFITRAELELSAFVALLDKNYQGFEAPMVQGFGGMADATGISASFGYVVAKARGEKVDPATALPPTPGITDFMAVWEQGKRRASWSADHTQLIDGGGQWNGNIPIPIFRNLAAELTIGLGPDTDVRVGVFGEDLLANLSAPVYPFDVNLALVQQGEALFKENCAVCHKPHNGKVYDVGTDLGRAQVVSESIAQSARQSFTGLCPPSKTVVMPPDGLTVKPCAEFEGVSLVNKENLVMLDPKDQQGYNALPLGGIWAQAAFLHNGSVPTLYHLLVPSERPQVFMKGRLDYDKNLGGYSWTGGYASSRAEEGYRFDTTAFPAFSNKGHDKNILEAGGTRKLDWSNDKAGAMAIVEYLKTL